MRIPPGLIPVQLLVCENLAFIKVLIIFPLSRNYYERRITEAEKCYSMICCHKKEESAQVCKYRHRELSLDNSTSKMDPASKLQIRAILIRICALLLLSNDLCSKNGDGEVKSASVGRYWPL